ncbi:hypothetical protein P3T36_002121 [Kitasatospora sp. MAP12-15]|uniref:hypothetical protein n=1 Tax=unclassified Kitasatospora TaxID=2633591 RepID=UPI002476947C|nr:hypothetical protein [Kitasatospora sp. MAP12-44]MDH6111807.1 hypothetical protein [Kitasatospora sp. MAP12-44]
MRASVISTFAKSVPSVVSRRVLATAAATLVISAAVPLLPGASTAFACGNPPAAGARVVGLGEGGFIPVVPDSITAGGAPIEVGEEVGPAAGSAGGWIAPYLAFYNPGAGQPGASNLRPADFTVQAMVDNQWKTLPVLHGCDPTIHADTSSVAQQVAAGHAMRVLFRITLSANAPSSQTSIQMFSSPDANGRPGVHTLKVLRIAAPSAKPAKPVKPAAHVAAPTTAAVAAAAPAAPIAAAPAVAVAQPAVPAAAAVAPAAAQPATPATSAPRLAATASDSSAVPLLGAGGALVALAAAALTFVLGRRRRSARR